MQNHYEILNRALTAQEPDEFAKLTRDYLIYCENIRPQEQPKQQIVEIGQGKTKLIYYIINKIEQEDHQFLKALGPISLYINLAIITEIVATQCEALINWGFNDIEDVEDIYSKMLIHAMNLAIEVIKYENVEADLSNGNMLFSKRQLKLITGSMETMSDVLDGALFSSRAVSLLPTPADRQVTAGDMSLNLTKGNDLYKRGKNKGKKKRNTENSYEDGAEIYSLILGIEWALGEYYSKISMPQCKIADDVYLYYAETNNIKSGDRREHVAKSYNKWKNKHPEEVDKTAFYTEQQKSEYKQLLIKIFKLA